MSDLHKDAPALQLRVLTSLPDEALPELDRHFAERAPHHPWLFGHLLARYGTATFVQQIRRTYERDHLRWGCDARFPFIAYFLRVNGIEGATVLRRALRERTGNGCFRSMLSSVSRIFPAAEIVAVAIESLDDADADVASNAAMMLSWHGSSAAEPPLWRRLQRWNDQWRDRPRELFGNGVRVGSPQYAQITLGNSLRGAIETAQAWYFDESRRQRLHTLCWTDDCRSQYAPQPARPTVRIRVHQLMYDDPRFEVGWYHPDTLERFRTKVAQFPSGTGFGWCTDREGGGELRKQQAGALRRQAEAIVESLGFAFVNDPPAGSCSTDSLFRQLRN